MGKDNNALCEYLDNNERSADLFNAQFFQGKQVVTPDELESISEKYIEKPVKTHHNQITTERIRDIQKRLKSGGILRVLAIESQTYVDYTMPWRCMNYDSLEYGKQIRDIKDRNMRNNKFSTSAERLCGFLKSDRIIPVYTICLYHGQEPWDGPRSLQDMMDFGEDSDQWRELFADYRFRLVCMLFHNTYLYEAPPNNIAMEERDEPKDPPQMRQLSDTSFRVSIFACGLTKDFDSVLLLYVLNV